MRSVGIKELKNRLSHYVRLVVQGETVLVTDRDEVVAELAPPAPGRSRDVTDALLAEGVRQGWIVPPLSTRAPLPPRNPVAALSKILREVSGDREDR